MWTLRAMENEEFEKKKHLNKQERKVAKQLKELSVRKQRRREKLWLKLQGRVFTDRACWDADALANENVEAYQKKVNKDCGFVRNEELTMNGTKRKSES